MVPRPEIWWGFSGTFVCSKRWEILWTYSKDSHLLYLGGGDLQSMLGPWMGVDTDLRKGLSPYPLCCSWLLIASARKTTRVGLGAFPLDRSMSSLGPLKDHLHILYLVFNSHLCLCVSHLSEASWPPRWLSAIRSEGTLLGSAWLLLPVALMNPAPFLLQARISPPFHAPTSASLSLLLSAVAHVLKTKNHFYLYSLLSMYGSSKQNLGYKVINNLMGRKKEKKNAECI